MRRLHHIFESETVPVTSPVSIVSLGHFLRQNTFRLPGGRPSWLLVFFASPVTVMIKDVLREVPSNTALIFPPDRPLRYGNESGFKHCFICVGGTNISGMMERHKVPVERVIPCSRSDFFVEAVHALDEELTSHQKPHAIFVRNILENLLINLGRAAAPKLAQTVDDRLMAALRHLECRYPEPLRLVEISAVAGLSPSHFSRAFKDAFGAAPIEMVIRLRLRAARERLLSTDQTVREISQEVGFSDPVHFSKIFTRHVGQSPQLFRRSSKTQAKAR